VSDVDDSYEYLLFTVCNVSLLLHEPSYSLITNYKPQTHTRIKHKHITTGNVEVHKIPLNNIFCFEGLVLGIGPYTIVLRRRDVTARSRTGGRRWLKIVPTGDWGHLLTLTLTSDDLESHILVNVSSTSNIIPSFIKIGRSRFLAKFEVTW